MSRKDLIEQGEQRRADIMDFLRLYIGEKGWAPTIQEIADAVHLVSPNSTRNHLLKLQELGYIRLEAKVARAIALVHPAPDGWERREQG